MSKPGIKYQLIIQNCEKLSDQQTFDEQTAYVDIWDNDYLIADDEDITIISLTGAEKSIEISTIDNSEEKFVPIRATQVRIRFLSDENIDMSTFSEGSATRWYVHIYLNNDTTKTIFKGHLVLGESSEDFLPTPNIVELVASDGLGLLKNIPLTNFDSENPTGHNRIADYLAWALSKTGLSLQLNTVFNIRHGFGSVAVDLANFSTIAGGHIFFPSSFYTQFYEGATFTVACTGANNGSTFTVNTNNAGASIQVSPSPVNQSGVTDAVFTDVTSGHFFDSIYLDAKTFEDQIGTCINCYDVLRHILKEEAELFQRNGEWWILRIDEIESSHGYYVSTYDSDGVFIEDIAEADYNKDIGKDDYVIFFSEGRTRVAMQMAHEKVELTYNYRTPKEIVCNIDFARGDLNTTVSPTEKRYDIDCWTLQKGSPLSPPGSPDISAYTVRIFNTDDYELERYIELTAAATNAGSDANRQYINSLEIEIHEKDKFSTSVDWRLKSSIGSNGSQPILFRAVLHGNDDSWWILGNRDFTPATYGDTNYKWWDTSGWTANTAAASIPISGTDLEETDWNNLPWEAPPSPVDGKLYLHLHQFNHEVSSWDDISIQYSNLTFEYIPYINGTYRKYTAQKHLVSQNINNKVVREEEVFVSDSPKKLFKGALKIFDGTNYVLTEWFYNAAVFPNGVPGSEFLHPYGEIQVFDVWNQFRNEMRIFQAHCQGLDSGSEDGLSRVDMISLLHKIFLQDPTQHTLDRYFKMLSNNIDWPLCEWAGTLIEVYNTLKEKDYTGHDFKYLS